MKEPYEDRRSISRGKAKIAVELLHDRLKNAVTQTYDYSDAGVLVERMPGMGILKPGMEIKIRIVGFMDQPPLVLAAQVIRIGDEGIALKFNEPITIN